MVVTTSNDGGGLRWGILGCGKISNDFVNAMRNMENVHFHACAARALTTAQTFATTHGFAHAYGSYEELVADPNVDVVYIGTIHISHYENTLLALRAGKHVLVEKPMSMNAKQAKHAMDVAREHKRFLMEGMWTRFFPAVEYVRTLIAEGAIGDVHHVNADIGYPMPKDVARVWDRSMGGGGLLDIGIYPLAFLTMVLGDKPEKISAAGQLTEGGVDKYCTATLEYSGDKFGTMQCSCLALMGETVTIIGSRGKILIKWMAHTASEIVLIVEEDGKRVEKVSVFPLPDLAASAPTAMCFGSSEGFVYEAMAVTKSILAGELENKAYPLSESLAIAKIMDTIRAQIGVVYDTDLQ